MLQIAALLVVGAVTVSRFHVFAEVDERAHLAYVQEVAEHGRIPWVGRDLVSWQEIAIEKGTYPHRSPVDPRLTGVYGSSYEGWQPPLYYVLAAPAFLIPDNYHDKITAVRAFDLFLLLTAVAILALLARAVFEQQWVIPYCLALSITLWPGVIVRAVTVSNAALEFPLAALYLLAVWRATTRPRARSLMAAAAVLGLCVLTQLTLVFLAVLLALPLMAWLRKRRDRRTLAVATLTLALPLILVAPWLASNETRYGALTASSVVKPLVEANGPPGPRSGLAAVASGLPRLSHAALPQEWWQEYKGVVGAVLTVLAALLLVGVLPTFRSPALLRSPVAWTLASPLVLVLTTLVGIVLLAAWPSALFPRYLNPVLPPFAMFSAWTWMRAKPSGRSLPRLAVASSLLVGVMWFYLAAAYYFPNVGASFGVHAAPLGP